MSTDLQKLCPLCLSSAEWPYDETGSRLHELFGLHQTLGKMWAPMKGHPDYELHVRIITNGS